MYCKDKAVQNVLAFVNDSGSGEDSKEQTPGAIEHIMAYFMQIGPDSWDATHEDGSLGKAEKCFSHFVIDAELDEPLSLSARLQTLLFLHAAMVAVPTKKI